MECRGTSARRALPSSRAGDVSAAAAATTAPAPAGVPGPPGDACTSGDGQLFFSVQIQGSLAHKKQHPP